MPSPSVLTPRSAQKLTDSVRISSGCSVMDVSNSFPPCPSSSSPPPPSYPPSQSPHPSCSTSTPYATPPGTPPTGSAPVTLPIPWLNTADRSTCAGLDSAASSPRPYECARRMSVLPLGCTCAVMSSTLSGKSLARYDRLVCEAARVLRDSAGQRGVGYVRRLEEGVLEDAGGAAGLGDGDEGDVVAAGDDETLAVEAGLVEGLADAAAVVLEQPAVGHELEAAVGHGGAALAAVVDRHQRAGAVGQPLNRVHLERHDQITGKGMQ